MAGYCFPLVSCLFPSALELQPRLSLSVHRSGSVRAGCCSLHSSVLRILEFISCVLVILFVSSIPSPALPCHPLCCFCYHFTLASCLIRFFFSLLAGIRLPIVFCSNTPLQPVASDCLAARAAFELCSLLPYSPGRGSRLRARPPAGNRARLPSLVCPSGNVHSMHCTRCPARHTHTAASHTLAARGCCTPCCASEWRENL